MFGLRGEAEETYRGLKRWYQRDGDYDTADAFHFREWECRRKLTQEEWRLARLSTYKRVGEAWLYRILSGYGVRPWRVIVSGAALILLFALLYMLFPWNGIDLSAAGLGNFVGRFPESLYFSGVSFTALGYGNWVESPAGLARYAGVVESFMGISLIALFLVTFTRKLQR